MFVPFSIADNPIETLEQWIAFVQATPNSNRGVLMDSLRRNQEKSGPPNFTQDGQGESLREWARSQKAGYTLMQEIKLAGSE